MLLGLLVQGWPGSSTSMTRIANGYFRSEEDARRYHQLSTDEKILSGEVKIGPPH
jgi:hypothetical protein